MGMDSHAMKDAGPNLSRLARFLAPHLKSQRKLVIFGFVGMFAEVVFRLLEPWPLSFVLDAVVAPGAAQRSDIGLLFVLCAVGVIAVAALRAGSAYLMTVCFALAGSRAMGAVRSSVFHHLLHLSIRFHNSTRSGDLINRLITDVGRLRDVATTAAMPLLGNIATLVSMVAVMMWMDWTLALAVVAAFPIFLFASSSSSKRITRAARLQRKREGDLAGTAGETIGAIKVIQAYSLQERLEGDFASSTDGEVRDGVKATRYAAGLERKTDLLVGVATGVVLLMGGWSVLDGRISPGELVVFVQYLKNAFKPMRDVAKYTGRIAKAAASGERIMGLLDVEPEISDAEHAGPIHRVKGHVRFEDVTLRYTPDAPPALCNVSFTVKPGQKVGLVGHSGSGKSSISTLLLRLIDPDDGSILLDGIDIRDVTVDSIRDRISVVLQDSVLFADTIGENIRLGRPSASDNDVKVAAKAANCHSFITALPDGYDTLVGERGETLSGGQRQRVAIARALLRDAPIVVLDEAISGLDATNSAQVVDALRRLTHHKTTFVITHDISEVSDCDVVLVMQSGRVAESGDPRKLLTDPASLLWELSRSPHGSSPPPVQE